jgi:PAS domain S-box-containing protein
MTKYSREALLSMNIKDMELDETHKQTEEHIQKIIAKGGDQFESRHYKSDGTFFHATNSVTYIPIEKILICFVNDISKRKKAEKDLLYVLEGLSGQSYGNL